MWTKRVPFGEEQRHSVCNPPTGAADFEIDERVAVGPEPISVPARCAEKFEYVRADALCRQCFERKRLQAAEQAAQQLHAAPVVVFANAGKAVLWARNAVEPQKCPCVSAAPDTRASSRRTRLPKLIECGGHRPLSACKRSCGVDCDFRMPRKSFSENTGVAICGGIPSPS
jgi:hypothetical protein